MASLPAPASPRLLGTLVAAAIVVLSQAGTASQVVEVNGAGATFPYPIYSTWFAEYAKVKPEFHINYQSIGSGGGIRQLIDLFVFFGATDTPLDEDEMVEAPGRILHLPTVVGAVVPVYNVPGVRGDLRFNGALLADIFLGKITNWNDPAIARLNPGVALPPTDITPISRAESSGTSFVWSDFLSKASPDWKRMMGVSRVMKLPVGTSARGSEGVSALVKQTTGAIGYVELIYATRNTINFGLVQNAEGEFVRASADSATKAGAAAVGVMPKDFRVSITNAPGKGVYPISSFTWILLYENPRDRTRSRLMVDFMRWALTEGQKFAPALGYAPLPPDLVKLEIAVLGRIRI